ncbi:hypothetical protein BDN70DRAFT_938070 [Pholiota conissans]|uniref:DUF6699 domain-containing protein n=1 Tax=Pholiota conissans TaxID=109636 RepID=A0A9P5YPZ9_9AGAR|nr:hypothetical protein BDN70DRAFT_938070 [Pholiota conissans]
MSDTFSWFQHSQHNIVGDNASLWSSEGEPETHAGVTTATPTLVPIVFDNEIGTESAQHAMFLDPRPPPPPCLVPIALPALESNFPVYIHALLRYNSSAAAIYWNTSLPPYTAVVRNLNGPWFHEIATSPLIPSITIRIKRVSRPIVVFPTQIGYPIRIVDVLNAIYVGMREAALEHAGTISETEISLLAAPSYSRNQEIEDAISTEAIRRHFQRRVWWNGLSRSTLEPDVWVLHLRGTSRGRASG